MKPLFRFSALVLSTLTLSTLLLGGAARASTVGISPVTMEINPLRQLTTVTTLSNQDTEPVEFTAQLVRWTQQGGKDLNEPTRDGLVNPPRFTIAPGRSQVVRVGLRVRPSAPEVTYRLLLTQVPKPLSAQQSVPSDKTTVTLTPTYVFSLPLFVERPGGQTKVSTRLERDAQGNLAVVFNNTGTRYAVYRALSATLGERVGEQGAGQTVSLGGLYVLAGSTMRVAIPKPLSAAGKLTLRYTNAEQQEQNETLDIPTP